MERRDPGRLIALTPRGPRTLDQDRVRGLAAIEPRIVLLCGRYEGFDERIFDVLQPESLSIGDYILSGGEVAAMVVIDAVMRLRPGRPGRRRERPRRILRPRRRIGIPALYPAPRVPRPAGAR